MATPQSIAQKLANISQQYYAGGDYAQASREIDRLLSELNPTDTERSYVKQQLLGEDTETVSGYLKQTGQELSDVGSNLVPLAKQSFANTLTEFGRPDLSPEDQKLFESQNNEEVDRPLRIPDVFELPGMAARGFRDYVLEPTGLMDLYREEVKPQLYQTGQEMITENAEDYGQTPMQRTFLGQAARSIPESIAPTAIGIGTGLVGAGSGLAKGVSRKAADITARVAGTGAALSSAPALLASEANRSIDAHPVWQELTKNMPDVEKNNLRQKLRSANNSAIFDEKFLNTMQLIQAGTALPQGSFFARLTADVLAEAAEEGFDDQPIVATVVNQNLQNYLRNTNNPLQNDPTLITNRWDWIKANPEAVLEGAAMGAVASLPVSGSVGLVEQVASPSINRPVGNPEEIQQMTNKIFENIQTLPGNNDALAEDLVTQPEFQDTIRGINNKVDNGRELQPKERKISKWYQEYVSKSLERSQQFLESTNQTESDVLAEPERQLAEGVGDEFNYFTNLENQAKRATAKTEPTITDSPFGVFSSNRQEDLPGIPALQESPGFEPLQETEVDEETARQTQEEQTLIDFYRQATRPETGASQQLDLPTFNQEGTRSIQPVQTEEEQAFAELDQQLAEQQPLTRAELEQIEQELDEIMPFTDRGFDLESDEVSPIQQVDEEIEQEIQAEADLQQQIENVSQADDQLRREVAFDLQTEEDQAVDQQIFDETQQQAQTLATNLEGIRNQVERDEDILRQIDQMESEETTQAVLADDQAVADAESETFQEDITQDPAAGLQELQDARDIEAEMDQPADLTFDLSPETTKKSEVLNGVKVNPDTKRGQEVLKQRELEVLKDVMSQYFPKASEVVVLDTTEELKQRENIPADVTGIEGATFRKGDGYIVYLIGENLKGKDLRSAIENGVKIYHHESIGHAGLMQMLGSRYNDFANKVYKNRQTEIDNFIKNRYPNGLPDDTPVRRASEWLAINFTEQGVEQLGILDTVTAVLRGETSDVGIKRKYQQVYKTLAAGRKPEIVIRPTGRASTETTDAPEEEAPNVELPASLQNVPRPTEKQIKKAQEKLKNVENAEETRAKTITEAETAASELTPQELSVPTNNKVNKVRDKLAEISVLDEMLGYSKAVVEAEQTQQDDMLGYSAPDEAAVSRTEFNLAKKFNTNSAKDTQILDTAINNTRKKMAALDAKIQEANQKDGASDNQLDNLNKLKVRLQALKNIRGEQPQQTNQTQVSQPDQTNQETSQQADQDDDVVALSPMGSFSSNRQQTPPPNTTGTQQERGLRRALDGLNKAFDPRALVPDREFFEKILQRAKGVQNEYVEAGQKLASVMMEANEAEQKLIYDYMTDRGADPNTIPDRQVRGFVGKQIRKRFNRENPTLREAAVEAKEIIEGIGRDLVRQGLLNPQTFKDRSGQYLPRLYLKYLDDNNLFSGAGGSLKVSPQGYLKQMRDIDPMIRTMLLGEIKSPGYLVGQTIMQAGQDVARMDFLKEVAQNKQWVLPASQVKLNIAKLTNDIIQRNNLGPQLIQEGLPAATRQAADRNVSPEFLEAEAKRLQDQILPSKPLGSAQRTLVQEIISEYSNLANKARADIPNYAVDKYRQLPNTNRYGDLRGAYVLKEIADIVAGDPFFKNEDSDSVLKPIERGVATINTLFKWGATAAYPVAWVNNVISNSAMMAFGGLPIHQNLQYRAKAIKEMATNGSRYQDYKDQGLTLSTFAADELGRLQSNFKTQLTPKDRRIMYDDSWFPNLKSAEGYAQVANIFGKIFNGFGNIYQSLEVIDKLALAMYLEDKGANVAGIPFVNEDKLTPQEAMREANKWLYDYSDVTPTVRKLRKSLLGAPFLTWTYKTVDRLARMNPINDLKASLRAAAYYGILYAAMSMKMADLDDDERDAFYEGLPDWYRKKGLFAVPMPEKDENDRIQIKDYSYAAPHAFIYQFFNTMFDSRYGIFDSLVDLGFTNHPILQQIIEQSANKNLYTGKPLYSEFDTGGQKAKKSFLHFADGVLPQLIAPSGWGKQMLETVSGDPNLLSGLGLDSATLDREGKPKLTPTQILGKADLTGLSQGSLLESPLLLNPASRPANIEDSLKFRRSRIIEELRSDRYRERTAIKQQTTAEGKRQKKLQFLEKRKRLMEGLKKVNRALKNLPDFEKPVRITSIEARPKNIENTGIKTPANRILWKDKNGNLYSEKTTTVKTKNGKWVTSPTVAADGSTLNDDEITDYLDRNGPVDFVTGNKLPEFNSKEDAINYAISRSKKLNNFLNNSLEAVAQ